MAVMEVELGDVCNLSAARAVASADLGVTGSAGGWTVAVPARRDSCTGTNCEWARASMPGAQMHLCERKH